ncbi:MAG TPA: O-antigen ligase family protein [Pyrinomonadaceae bacterium]|nr:O-antigen ligase family protein [Pyrinomonadaceae bacterium]
MPTKHPFTDDYEPVAPPARARAATRAAAAEGEGAADAWALNDTRTTKAGGNFESAGRSETDAGLENNGRERLPGGEAVPLAGAGIERAPVSSARFERGHLLSYIGLFLFTAVLYFRPYELHPSLAGLTSLAYWLAFVTLAVYLPTQLALEGNLTARPREVNLVLLLCLCALLSIPLAIDPGEAWTAFNYPFIRAVAMFIVIVNVVRTPLRLKGLMFLGLAVGIVLSAGAINDYRLGRVAVEEGERVSGVVGGMFGNPNDMALHLVVMIPLAIGLLLSTRNLLAKPLYAVCALLMVGGIIASFSRGAFLGLLGASIVLGWKLGRRNRLLMIVLVAIFVVALVALAPGEYTERLSTIGSVNRDASSSSRRDLLVRSIIVAIYNPVFGVGIGNFHIVSIRELVSHNAYTQVAAEMGLVAAVIYVSFIVVPIRRLSVIEHATYATRRGSRIYYLSVGLQASLIAFMISSFFGSVAYQFSVYYLVGYAVALRRIYEARTGTEVVPLSRKEKRAARRVSGSTPADNADFPAPGHTAPATTRI